MKPRYQVSNAGVALIKRFEGYRRTAARLADGGWTIGYGHSRSARQGAEVSEDDAEALLRYDLIDIVGGLNDLIFTPLTQNQFDALASFAFNISLDNFRSSSVLRRLNEGALLQAASAIEMWRGADFEGERIVVDALVRRRAAEKALFLTPADGFVPAPTPVIEPRLDYAARATAPTRPATILETPFDSETAMATRAAAPADEPEPSETSPSQAAAEGVTVRLQALIDDLDERPIIDPSAFQAVVETAADEPVEPRPFGTFGAHPRASFDVGVRPEAKPASVETDPASTVRPGPRAQGGPIGWSMFDSPTVTPMGLGLGPLAVLGLIGMAVFAGAVFWMFNARPAGGLIGPMGLGALVAIIGVLCVVSAIYFLLERLGGRED